LEELRPILNLNPAFAEDFSILHGSGSWARPAPVHIEREVCHILTR